MEIACKKSMHILVSFFIAVITLVMLVFPGDQAYCASGKGTQGARSSGRVQKILSLVRQNPVEANKPVTLIYEGILADASIQFLRGLGGRRRFSATMGHEIILPAGKVEALLAVLPSTGLLRLPFPHHANAIGQGVPLTGASDMHNLGNDGTGVTVGIIDVGFATLAVSQAAGELPQSLTIVDYTGTGTGGKNHGTDVAEIVHDMAPGADLFLAKVASSVQMETAVNDMIAAGVKIINHSVGWYGAAFYDGTGVVCGVADMADAAGILWVNSAGNARNYHYLATFNDLDGDLRHDFAAGQNYNTVSLNAGAAINLTLNWDDYAAANVNYDLFLYDGDPDAGGNLVASSSNNQGTSPFDYPYPLEIISYTASTTATYYIVVSKEQSNTTDLPLSLFTYARAFSVKTRASSLTQPADGFAVLGVGATDLTDGPEWFSSEGPTTDGRDKPEISGPDRVTTSNYASFSGTSASSPHLAGAAALILAQNPAFSPAQLKNALIATAQDVSSAGFDYRTGYGRLSLDADQDGWNHDQDNCVVDPNPSQLDTDLDGAGDACDDDDDDDGLADILELQINTDPLLKDTDGDGLGDFFEVAFDGNAASYIAGLDLNPLVPDTDGDGLSDYYEVAYDGTPLVYVLGQDLNPLSQDTDGDGLADGSDILPLAFHFLDGDIAPLGQPDGLVTAADYALALRILFGEILPGELELTHADLYPAGAPDGILELGDVVLLLQLLN